LTTQPAAADPKAEHGDSPSRGQLLETWEIHNRVNLYVLDAVEPEHLSDTAAAKGRSVGEQFAHMHNVRLLWLKQAAPELVAVPAKVEKEAAVDKALLRRSLEESGRCVGALLAKTLDSGGRVKGFKPHATAFVGYLIAHEAHHRSQAILALKESKHPLGKKTLFGMWEWGVR
jgi:uncharacterized damage-inducible protein DinB